MRIRPHLGLASAAVMAALLSPLAALAQEPPWLSYAVKFVCGAERANPDLILTNGIYRTLINIHNPHYITPPVGGPPLRVVFYKKAVLAMPQGENPLPPSCKQEEVLEADWAISVTCANIQKLLIQSGLRVPRHYEGFVVIEVPPIQELQLTPDLDVVAVYMARHRTGTNPDIKDYDVQTMDVEAVTPKRIIGIPDPDLCEPN